MQVQNTTARTIRLPGVAERLDGGNVRLLNQGIGRNLVPGDNFVEDAEWAAAKKAKLIKMCLATDPPMLREGTTRPMPEEDLPGGQILDSGPPDNLFGLAGEVVKVKIADCQDRDTLTKWAAADNRSHVINRIEKRLAELSG